MFIVGYSRPAQNLNSGHFTWVVQQEENGNEMYQNAQRTGRNVPKCAHCRAKCTSEASKFRLFHRTVTFFHKILHSI